MLVAVHEDFGDAEVDYVELIAVAGHEHVFRLDVAVHDASLVDMRENLDSLVGDLDTALETEAPKVAEVVTQIAAK